MADNKVKFLRGSSADYATVEKNEDTFYYTTDDKKLYLGNELINGGSGSNVQSDWDETDTTSDAYINNKPDVTPHIELTQAEYDEFEAQGKLEPDTVYFISDGKAPATSLYMPKENPTGTGSFSMNTTKFAEVGEYAFNEGYHNSAAGRSSHAEGEGTYAPGKYSHASGFETSAQGEGSYAEGLGTIVRGNYSHVQGKYNQDTETNYAHIVGNGTSYDNRSNAHTLDWDGNAWFAGDVTVGSDKDKLAKISEIPTSLPANGGNADTVDGSHAWNLQTLSADGNTHGSVFNMYCKHNVLGDGKFYIGVTDGYERNVAVGYAENADTVSGLHIITGTYSTKGHSLSVLSRPLLIAVQNSSGFGTATYSEQHPAPGVTMYIITFLYDGSQNPCTYTVIY